MSDLISRSKLIKAFNNKNVQITFDLPVEEVLGEDVDLDDFAMLVQDAIQVYKKMVIDTIENQPTAYDVDKVVEELEERKHEICLSDDDLEHYQNGIDNAIEIVKQGGVSDDVCEWRICDEETNVYDTSCRNPHILIEGTPKENNYEYCPYCGKKIKVVKQMNTKKVDKTKKSNIKCEHCEAYDKDSGWCCIQEKEKNYWNRCKYFIWHHKY